MTMLALRDLDALAARLHGRRSRLADGARLAALCALGSPAALAAELYPGEEFASAAGLQGRLAAGFAAEADEIAACLGGPWREYAALQAGVFRLWNLKTALRGLLAGADRGEIAAALLPLPPGPDGCGPELAGADGPGGLAALVPAGPFRYSLTQALAGYGPDKPAFFHEAALDRDHLARLAALAAALGPAERSAGELCAQEAAAFNLMTAAAGRFVHGYSPEELKPLYAPGPALDARRFARLLAAASPSELRALAAGSAVDAGPAESDLSALEALAWRRYARLAGRTLRRTHLGPGAAAAYLALRRIETLNLVSVAEGLRLRTDPAELARRLIPRAEAVNV